VHVPRLDRVDSRVLGLAVFGAALAIRVVYLLDIGDNPFFRVPIIDAEFYHQIAYALSGPGIGSAPFQMPPGWPLLLSLVYRVIGPSLVAAHVVQILLGAGTATLTFALGRRLGGVAVGLVAAGFVATSKALLFLEGDLGASPLCICLDVAAVFFLVRWVQDGERRRDLVGAGLALGVSAITLPLVLVFVVPLLVWMGWKLRRPAAAAVLALLVLSPILPVTWRNWRSSGELVFISANGGINFWLGNNPDWRSTSVLRPGPEWRAMQELPQREAGIVASSARDRWFLRAGWRNWISHPLGTLVRTGEKAAMLLHSHEVMRDFDYYVFRDRFSWMLRLPGWNFAVLLGLAVVGLVWVRSRAAGEWVPLLFLASYAAGILLFFVTARYRAPLLPLLALFASRALLWLVSSARRRHWPAVARGLGLAIAVFILSTVDFLGQDAVDTVEADYRIATTFEKSGRFQDALLRYDAVLERAPDHPLAAARAAVCAQMLGRSQEAVNRYEALLERYPDYAEAAVNLANLAAQHGDREAAAHYFDAALAADPFLPQAHASYGLFLLQNGDASGAAAALGTALEYDPTWEALRVDRARALLAAGDVTAARSEIDRAARVMPVSDRLELVRGDVLSAQGQPAEARAAWERGLRANPSNAELRARLGGLEAAP
jgi:tetratricopeptide (TPR) repeat protein